MKTQTNKMPTKKTKETLREKLEKRKGKGYLAGYKAGSRSMDESWREYLSQILDELTTKEKEEVGEDKYVGFENRGYNQAVKKLNKKIAKYRKEL